MNHIILSSKDLLTPLAAEQAFKPRFEPFTFSKHVEYAKMCNRMDQTVPKFVATILRITLITPALFLALDLAAKVLQGTLNFHIPTANLIHRAIFGLQTDHPPASPKSISRPSLTKSTPEATSTTAAKEPSTTDVSAKATSVAAEPASITVTTINDVKEPSTPDVPASTPAVVVDPPSTTNSTPPTVSDIFKEEPTAPVAPWYTNNYAKGVGVGFVAIVLSYVAGRALGFNMNPFSWWNSSNNTNNDNSTIDNDRGVCPLPSNEATSYDLTLIPGATSEDLTLLASTQQKVQEARQAAAEMLETQPDIEALRRLQPQQQTKKPAAALGFSILVAAAVVVVLNKCRGKSDENLAAVSDLEAQIKTLESDLATLTGEGREHVILGGIEIARAALIRVRELKAQRGDHKEEITHCMANARRFITEATVSMNQRKWAKQFDLEKAAELIKEDMNTG